MNKSYEKQIDEIFMRWYQGEKTALLLIELGIQKTHNLSFSKHFPPIACEASCPYCAEDMYAFRSDSITYKKTRKLYDSSTAHCSSCGHFEKKACRCEGCNLERIEESRMEAAKESERLTHRAILLQNLYDKVVPIDFGKSDLKELIYFYTLCQQSTCEDVTIISPPSTQESILTPSNDWDKEIIDSLSDYIAPYCEDDKLLKFSEDGEARWYVQLVFYRIKIKDIEEIDFLQSMFIHIKDRIQNLSIDDKFELVLIFEKLMILECIAYLEFMRSDFDLPHEVGKKTTALFKSLIQNWRIDQIYTAIWVCCKEAVAYKTQNGLPKNHASNLVIGQIERYLDKAQQRKWEIKGYYRDSNKFIKNKQSSLSYVLFNKLLGLGGKGIEYNFQDVLSKFGQTESPNTEEATSDFAPVEESFQAHK